MIKVLTVLAIMLWILNPMFSMANRIEFPKLPVPLESFEKIELMSSEGFLGFVDKDVNGDWFYCAVLVPFGYYKYRDYGRHDQWMIFYYLSVKGSDEHTSWTFAKKPPLHKNPFLISHYGISDYIDNGTHHVFYSEYWIDRDRDGYIDEYIRDYGWGEHFPRKYSWRYYNGSDSEAAESICKKIPDADRGRVHVD